MAGFGRGVLDPEIAKIARKANLHRNAQVRPSGSDPDVRPDAIQSAAAEEIDNARALHELNPEQIARNAVIDYGSPEAVDLMNASLFDQFTQKFRGKQWGRKTKEFEGTITGDAPTVILPVGVRAEGMGSPEQMADGGAYAGRVAATKITPWQLLKNLTGDVDLTNRIYSRIAERNAPLGDNGAAVYHTGNIEQDATTPWYFYRALGDRSWPSGGNAGYAHPFARQVFLNADLDPNYSTKWSRGSGMNVGQHEAIHTILHGNPWDADNLYRDSVSNRPAISGVDADGIKTWPAKYLASNAEELGNGLFHLKRLVESVNPKMRDAGENPEQFIDYVRNFTPSPDGDPLINVPGHIREGKPAQGHDFLMQTIQEILKNADKPALDDIHDMNFKTGQTSDLRKALLS